MGSKTSAIFFGVSALALLFVAGGTLYMAQQGGPQKALETRIQTLMPPTQHTFSLVVEPEDSMAPLEALIKNASSSIDLVMYELEDKSIERLLATKEKEGVAVRVILDNGYFGGGSAVNEQAFDYLDSNGVAVRWSPEYFALTHQKSLVVDDTEALVMTFNLSPKYYKSDRDFGVIDDDQNDVAAVEAAFGADWNGTNAPAQNGDNLVWSPNSRDQILSLIDSAQNSLDIYNEEVQDPQIVSALDAAAERGVNVEVDMTYADNWNSAFQQLSDAGVHVRTYAAGASLYIHAKVIMEDGKEAFVGSENFSETSLDQNRELGIIVSDPKLISSLSKTFAEDWQNASPFLVQ